MNKETIEAIQVALAPVAEKIGQGAAYGWEVVVRQQYVEGITSLIIAGIALIVFIAAMFALRYQFTKADSYDFPFAGFFGIFGGIMSFAIGTSSLVIGVQKLLNPEYYALQFFITLGQSAIGG